MDLLLTEGITFAGIDMIGDFLTEINVTSPTGAREILDDNCIKCKLMDCVENIVNQG